MRRSSPSLPLARRLGLSVVSLGLVLALVEGGLWLFGVGVPSLHVVDRHTGVKLRPGVRARLQGEGSADVRVNAFGLRGPETSVEKPEGVFRVAVLGDSYAEAFQVEEEEAFPSVVERELAGCKVLAGRRVEVLNFGVSGYGTAQEWIALRTRVRPFAPDAILLAFNTGNDIANNHRGFGGHRLKPYYEWTDGQLVLDDAFRNDGEYLFRTSTLGRVAAAAVRNFRILQLAKEAVHAWRIRSRASDAEQEKALPGMDLGLFGGVYDPSAPAPWPEAWRVTEALLRAIRDEAASLKAVLLVTTLSNAPQVHPDPAMRRRLATALGVEDLWYPDRRIADFGRREGVAMLSLGSSLAAIAERSGSCLHGHPATNPCTGHWNRLGHRLGGEGMAAALCRVLEAQSAMATRPEPG